MRCVVALLCVTCGLAQPPVARLEGVILDSSGSGIREATLTATSSLTGRGISAVSDMRGWFVFPSLPPGEYTLTVEAQGFRKTVLTGVILGAAKTVTETITLEIGPFTQTVTIQAGETAVHMTDAQAGQSISQRDIDVLPQLERYSLALALLQPGVQVAGGNVMSSRVNGNRRGSNVVKLDGIDATDPWAPNLLWSPFATTDSTQEFRMITHGAKAEFGRNAGAQIEMVTRSGSNRWSGTASNHVRNTALNANDLFNNSSRPAEPRPKFIQNIFGVSVGGPLVRNRSFVFGSYQGRRLRQEFVRNRVVLTPSARGGIFRWIPPSSSDVQSFDIVQNDPRRLGIDPRIAAQIRLLPDPNNYDVGDGLNTGGFRFNSPGELRIDQFTFRGDHHLTPPLSLFFRVTWSGGKGSNGVTNSEAPFPGQAYGTLNPVNLSYSLGCDWTISAHMINELRFGFQRQQTDRTTARLPEAMLVSSLWTAPLSANFKQDNATHLHELTDNLSFVRGPHVLKTGANAYFIRARILSEAGVYPNVFFDRSSGNIPLDSIGPARSVISTADRQRFADLYNHLLARISQVSQTFYGDLTSFQPAGTPKIRNFLFRDYAWYLQDDWKLRRNLTLNVGVRYEFYSPPRERDGLQGTLDRAVDVNRWTPSADTAMRRNARWHRGDYNNFAPRVGVAWAPGRSTRTAIRAHYGIFFERPVGSVTTLADNFAPGFSVTTSEFPNEVRGSDHRISDGIPVIPPPAEPEVLPQNNRRERIGLFDPDLRTGYVQQYGLTIARELLPNVVVEAAYVGNRGVKLLLPVNVNQLRIHDGFLDAFRELQSFQSHGSAVAPTNTLVRMFGSPNQAIAAIGPQLLAEQSAGAAADRVDTVFWRLYPAAGVSDFYLRNYPQYAAVVVAANEGRSYYDSLQFSLQRQAGRLKVLANYTWSKTIDLGSTNGLFAERPPEAFNLRLNRARADFDRPHIVSGMFVYSLPATRRDTGACLRRWVMPAVGGWDVGVLGIWESGSPFSVMSGRRTFTGDVESYANYEGDRNIGRVHRRDGALYWFTPDEISRFAPPGAGEIGSSGRNAFRGPRWFNIDLSLAKRFRMSERHSVIFRAEAYNLFNNPNFANPAANLTTPASFGKIGSTARTNGVPVGGDSGGPRIVQLALRYEF